EKARAVFQGQPRYYVLAADTIVVIDEVILGKPSDATDAARMLHMLSGRTHAVITGVCLVGPNADRRELRTENWELRTAFERTGSETTYVTMSKISDNEIRDYVATGEPMDKAGAYAIQGLASRWIPRIEGDYSNVVGLPVSLVYKILREQGAL
ncbi:MAG: Maf family protein, partial [Candidatus Sulfotelmatobacter sp.]